MKSCGLRMEIRSIQLELQYLQAKPMRWFQLMDDTLPRMPCLEVKCKVLILLKICWNDDYPPGNEKTYPTLGYKENHRLKTVESEIKFKEIQRLLWFSSSMKHIRMVFSFGPMGLVQKREKNLSNGFPHPFNQFNSTARSRKVPGIPPKGRGTRQPPKQNSGTPRSTTFRIPWEKYGRMVIGSCWWVPGAPLILGFFFEKSLTSKHRSKP